MPRRCLFKDGVHVGATDPEGAQCGAVRRDRASNFIPIGEPIDHVKRRVFQVQLRVWVFVVERRGDLVVVQAQGDLDTAGEACDRVHMADIGFDRANAAKPCVGGVLAIDFTQGSDFDEIAQFGAGAMGFDIADGFGVDTGGLEYAPHDVGLALDARRVEADLAGPVVIGADAAQQGVYLVAVSDGVGGALEQDHGDALAADHAVRVGVKGLDVAVAGKIEPILVQVADARGGENGAGADQGMGRPHRISGIARRHRVPPAMRNSWPG